MYKKKIFKISEYLDAELFLPTSEPKGIVQIIHGMSEHSMRYINFGEFLNKFGYIVVLSDHYAHGEKAYLSNKLGVFEKDFEILIQSQLELSKKLRKVYPKLTINILGHSMGSFIAQKHMKKFSDINTNYIFMGSCYQRRIITWFGKCFFEFLSKITWLSSEFYHSILFLGVNSKIKSKEKSKYLWLSRDVKSIREFEKDKYCGFKYSVNFYPMFLDFLFNLNKKDEFIKVDKNKRILIISGSEDPIGEYSKGVKKLFQYYLAEKFNNVKIKLYKGARHELLNEVNKYEVYLDLLEWIKIEY